MTLTLLEVIGLDAREIGVLAAVVGAGIGECYSGTVPADDPLRSACDKLELEPIGHHGEPAL